MGITSWPRNVSSLGLAIVASAGVILSALLLAPRLGLLKVSKAEEDDEDEVSQYKQSRFCKVSFREIRSLSDVAITMKVLNDICSANSLSGRVHVSSKGINGCLSGSRENCDAFMESIRLKLKELQGTRFGLSASAEEELFHSLQVWESDDDCTWLFPSRPSVQSKASQAHQEAEKPQSEPQPSAPEAIQLPPVAVLKLDDLVKLDALKAENGTRISQIWLDRFREESSVIAGVLSRKEFVPFRAASKICPTFLAPIRRDSDLVNFVWHVQDGRILYQSLQACKGGASGAGAGRADIVLTLFTELLETHEVVLLHAQLCSDILTKQQAAQAIKFTRCAYTTPQWLKWVKTFNQSPSEFDFEAFIAEFMQFK